MKLTACLVMVAISSSVASAQTVVGQKVGLVQYLQASYDGIKRDLAYALGL